MQAMAGNAVLFDLDGTLVDTAPDMVDVLQRLQADRGTEPVDYELGRSHVSNGSLGLIALAFGDVDELTQRDLQKDYLKRYEQQLFERSVVFPGLDGLLDSLDECGRAWGVVTNKPAFLTVPLLEGLGLYGRSAATVSGDTLKVRKPDPAPLLHACDQAGLEPASTIYVGDALRDIEAGRNAGMQTIGAAYGYVTADDDPSRWGADIVVDSADELASVLRKAFNL